jgi:hypothetical protein
MRIASRAVTAVAVVGALLAGLGPAAAKPAGESRLVSGQSPLTGQLCPGATPTEVESFPWLAVDPQRPSRRLAVWLQDGEAGVVGATTTDGGRRWRGTVPTPLLSCTAGDTLHVSEPRVAVTPSGVAYATAYTRDASTTSGHTLVARSTDWGRTWSATARPDVGLEPLNDFDALAVAPDRSDVVYVLWSQPEVAGEPTLLARSSDGGTTWTQQTVRVAVPGTASWSRLAVAPGGRLVVVYQDAPLAALFSPVAVEGPVWAVTSGDDGATWSLPALLGQGTPLQWPSVAVSPSGDIHASWVRPGDGDCRRLPPVGEAGLGCEAVVVRSTDGGVSWSAPAPVLSWTGAWVPSPALAVTGSGTVGLLATLPVTSDRLQPVLAQSTDCGATWSAAPVAEGSAYGPAEPGEADGHGLALQLTGLPSGFAAAVVRGAPFARQGPVDVHDLDVPAGRSSCAR